LVSSDNDSISPESLGGIIGRVTSGRNEQVGLANIDEGEVEKNSSFSEIF
jgi:hypothetical protein